MRPDGPSGGQGGDVHLRLGDGGSPRVRAQSNALRANDGRVGKADEAELLWA
jgi:GTPase involved in cell partitioning and DNA repair